MGKRRVKIRRRNWNVDCYRDLINGDGFQITEPAGFSLNGTKKKAMYGAQSPLYGTTYGDEQEFIERYRCDCGAFKSQMFEGEICPKCGTKVRYKDSNIKFTGWINLGTDIVINPYYYKVLCSALGKKPFEDIITSKFKVDKNGNPHKVEEEDIDEPFTSPFSFIGIDQFFLRYEEILGYFKKKRKNKVTTIELLEKEKGSVFTSHIPIYSTMMRQQSITSDTYYFKGIDKHINTLFSLSEVIKHANDIEHDYVQQRIQTKVNAMWDINFEMINGKEGFIREQILGGSLNYVARNVIIPDPTLKDNEVDLSYHTFLVMFMYKIMYYIMKIDGVSLSAAYSKWQKAYIFDEEIYEIMLLILEREKIHVLINRNPTLNYYSMLILKVRTVKKRENDYTLSVPLSILPGLNADQLSRSGHAAMHSQVLCERLTSGVSCKAC